MRRRRSKEVRLVLLAAVPAALGACGDGGQPPAEPEAVAEERVFRDEADCAAALDGDRCRAMGDEARREHAQTAPRYDSLGACEAAHGAGLCADAPARALGESRGPGTLGAYMPAMVGFMVAGAAAGAVASAVAPVPLYAAPPTDAERRCRERPDQQGCPAAGGGGGGARYVHGGGGGYVSNYAYSGRTVGPATPAGNVRTSPARFSGYGGAAGAAYARTAPVRAAAASGGYGRPAAAAVARGGFGGAAAAHGGGGS